MTDYLPMLQHIWAAAPAPVPTGVPNIPSGQHALNQLQLAGLGLANTLLALIGALLAPLDAAVMLLGAYRAVGHVWKESIAGSVMRATHTGLVMLALMFVPAFMVGLSNAFSAHVAFSCRPDQLPGFVQPVVTWLTAWMITIEGGAASIILLAFTLVAGVRGLTHLLGKDLPDTVFLFLHAWGNVLFYSSPAILMGIFSYFGVQFGTSAC